MLDPDGRFDWYLPRGPLALPPGGAHWYAVREVGYPDPETFAEGFAELAAFIDAVPHPHVAVGGFSQGAVMSLATGLAQGRPRPAAVLALSGFLPQVEGFVLDREQPFPPIAIGHGIYDPVIPVSFGRSARTTLEAAGATVVYHESPLDHTIDPAFVDELGPWLAEAIGAAAGSAR
jgi:phospholipase/carboxylesterase